MPQHPWLADILSRIFGGWPAIESTEPSINDLALDEATQKRNIPWTRQQIDQPTTGAEQSSRDLTGHHGGCMRRKLGQVDFFPAEKFADQWHFKLERQSEKGLRFAGFDNLADNWQVDGGQQESRAVVGDSTDDAFCLATRSRSVFRPEAAAALSRLSSLPNYSCVQEK